MGILEEREEAGRGRKREGWREEGGGERERQKGSKEEMERETEKESAELFTLHIHTSTHTLPTLATYSCRSSLADWITPRFS